MLLGQVDQRTGLSAAVAAALHDPRNPDFIVHEVRDLVAQRLYGLCCGYEDLNDHAALRDDPLMQTAVGTGETLGSSPTLCRLNTIPRTFRCTGIRKAPSSTATTTTTATCRWTSLPARPCWPASCLCGLENDEDAKDRTTKRFKEAWTQAPTRLLTKELWERVFSSINSDSSVFAERLESLRKSMVPEAMGLGVTMAQRIAAITVRRKMIEADKTETHLQWLRETFPWLLGPQWERLVANQTIKTLVTEKHKPDEAMGGWSVADTKLKLRLDFVFLSDAGAEKKFIVFEFKGPEAGRTLQPSE